MSYYYFFYYIFIILFPIIGIIFELKISYKKIYLYSCIFILIIIHYILFQINDINWKGIDNELIWILIFSCIPIFLNLLKKRLFYYLLIILYTIIFMYMLIFNVFINFLSERNILLSNKNMIIYMDSNGWSWSDKNWISITWKHKIWFFEKTFFNKTYEDTIFVDIKNTNNRTFVELRTDSWILFTENVR